MTIYYVDPANGNDAAAGTSWGAAWKTLLNGPTFARLGQTDSDEIRIAKSPDPVAIGNMTWTNQSYTMTFAGCSNITVDNCESGWTAGLVTPTYTTSYYRQGTAGLQAVMAASNGKICYKSFASVDYSTTSRITFWVNFGTAVNYAAGCPVFIDLCSDTLGATPVNSFNLPRYYYPANSWVPITIDFTGPLGSSIQSVAIRTTASVTNTVRFDNIQVIQSAASASSLSLTDLIAKDDGTGSYYAINFINGTSIDIGGMASTQAMAANSNKALYYSEDGTVTVPSLKRICFTTAADVVATSTSAAVNAINYTNDTNWPNTKTYLGGYNTATDTIDGETWFDGATGNGFGLTQTNSKRSSYSISNVSVVRYYNLLTLHMGSNVTITNTSLVSPANLVYVLTGNDANGRDEYINTGFSLDIKWIYGVHVAAVTSYIEVATSTHNLPWSIAPRISITNAFLAKQILSLGSAKATFTSTGTITSASGTIFDAAINTIGANGVGVQHYNINNLLQVITSSSSPLIKLGSSRSEEKTVINITGYCGYAFTGAISNTSLIAPPNANPGRLNCIINGNGNSFGGIPSVTLGSGVYVVGSASQAYFDVGQLIIKDYNLTRTNAMSLSTGSSVQGSVIVENFNGTAGDNRLYSLNTSGTTWARTPYWRQQAGVTYAGGTAIERLFPAGSLSTESNTLCSASSHPLGTAALKAGSAATITIRARRNSSLLTAKLVVNTYKAEYIASCTTTDQWELLTVTFTPTENITATIDIESMAQSNTASSISAFFDDLQVTQA